jgi:hypothetical protein
MKLIASEGVENAVSSSAVGRFSSTSKLDRAFVERAKGVGDGITAMMANSVVLLGVVAMVKKRGRAKVHNL